MYTLPPSHITPYAASNFEVDLIYQDGQVLIGGTLPAFIVGFFSLQVRFHSVESVPREENAIISDPSLADTNKINIKIPKDKLPSFRTFSVAVAIRSSGENGPFTENTEPLGKNESTCMQYNLPHISFLLK